MPATANILVVEDEDGIRDLLKDMLEDAGYEVQAVPHGRAALDLLETWSPDLILLDLRMPVMDGWQFLAAYGAREGRRAPVVVCAAMTQSSQSVLAAGAAAFIPKPFAINVLLQTVARQLAEASAAAPAAIG
jgi:two-component system chemotaxis response regulator CheY